MNWDAIGAVGEVVGAAGVVISLIYLATQIRSSTKFTKLSTVSESMNSFIEYGHGMSGNRELTEITLKGMVDPTSLNAVESTMFTHHVSAMTMMWFKTYLQFVGGLIDEDFWRTCERDMAGYFKSEGVQIVWGQISSTFTPEFVALVDSLRSTEVEKSAEFFPQSLES